MIHQSGKITNFLLPAVVLAIGLFSAYVLFTTENTIVVINEAVKEPKEELIAGRNAPIVPAPEPAPQPNPRVEILGTGVGFLNVRSASSIQGTKVGQVKPGEVYEYVEVQNNWYHILHPDIQEAWISGQYVKEVDRSGDLFGE